MKLNNNSKFIIISVCSLLCGFIASFLLRPYLPVYFPYTSFSVTGVIFGGLVITASIIISKRIYRNQGIVSYFGIILRTVFIIVLSELLFQLFRQFTMGSDSLLSRLVTIGNALLFIAIFSAIVSFLTVFHVKTKRTGYLILMIIGIYILLFFSLNLFYFK